MSDESKELYDLKSKCHSLINERFKTKDEVRRFYSRLSRRLKMRPENCHLSLMDKKYLLKTLELLEKKLI